VLRDQKKLTEAEAILREALAICRKKWGADTAQVVLYLDPLAGVLKEENNFTEAEVLYREAIAIHRKRKDEYLKTYFRHTVNGLAGVLLAQGKLDELETFWREILPPSFMMRLPAPAPWKRVPTSTRGT